MAGIPDYSTTPASNASVGSVNFAEGQAPSTVNDSARQLMADLAAMYQLETAAGTDTYTLTLDIVPSAYSVKMPLYVLFTNANTGAATLNVNSLGAKAIKKRGGIALVAGDIVAGKSYLLIYDGTNFEIQGASDFAHGADVASAGTINLDSATGDLVDVTGTTTITAITLAEGRCRTVRFTGALTLTHGSSLVLPSSANITTVAGDYAIFRGYASGVVRCIMYSRGTGQPLIPSSGIPTTTLGGGDSLVSTTLANLTSLSSALTSGKTYKFRAEGSWQCDVAGVGLKLGITTPSFTTLACGVTIFGHAADGTDATWQGVITASGGSVTATGLLAINTNYLWVMEGVIVASSSANLQIQGALETVAGGPTITISASVLSISQLN